MRDEAVSWSGRWKGAKMKEVFEKIVEILENKAHEAEKDMQLSDNYADAQAYGGKQEGYENAIEIVKKESEKFDTDTNVGNNGWIPCSEWVPKVEDLHEKSVDDCTCYLIQRRCGIMDVAHYIKVYGEPYFEANSIKMKDVVAWHPLPEPYNPKGE